MVSHPLRMRKALGSNPSVYMFIMTLAALFVQFKLLLSVAMVTMRTMAMSRVTLIMMAMVDGGAAEADNGSDDDGGRGNDCV